MEQIEPVPFEDWTPREFVPFSPRHVSVQPESDLSLQFFHSVASQQAENLHLDAIGQYSLQHSDDELESFENAIDMEVQYLLSRCFPTGMTGNTCASCNVLDNDKSSEDGISNDDLCSDAELESETGEHSDSSLNVDFYTFCLKPGTYTYTACELTSHCNLDSSDNQMDSTCESPLLEECLVSDHIDNRKNASVFKQRKGKNNVSVKSSVNSSKLSSETSSKSDDNICKEGHVSQSDSNESYFTDDQPVTDKSRKQHRTTSACNHQSSDTQVKQQSAKNKSQISSYKKNKKRKSNSKFTAASHTECWQVINISERCCLYEYKQELLHQPVPVHHTNFSRQVYCHIGERWGLSCVRHVRGDHYAAVRAILSQALVNNFLQENAIGKFQHSCQKLHVFADAQNSFLHCWNFANRIPYEKGREVEVLSDCLEEFHGVIETMSCVPSHASREHYLMCLLNRKPEVDARLLESAKFLMMERALCVYRLIEWRKQHCYPQPAEFWLFSSLCPERLFRQRINPLGDSVNAGPMEYQLLGYALGIQIEIIRPALFNCCDFVTRYLLENMKSSDNLCLIVEEDNEYCILTV